MDHNGPGIHISCLTWVVPSPMDSQLLQMGCEKKMAGREILNNIDEKTKKFNISCKVKIK